jgi:hypothetical protein
MFLGILKKKTSGLAYHTKKEKMAYDLFISKIKDGEEVEIFMAIKGKKANLAQISKVHASIRTIALELGYSFEDMKLIIKMQSGLFFEAEDEAICKSFADCTSEEISLAIQACNEVAEKHGIILG